MFASTGVAGCVVITCCKHLYNKHALVHMALVAITFNATCISLLTEDVLT